MFSVSMLAVSVNMDHAWEPAALLLSDSHPSFLLLSLRLSLNAWNVECCN